jgi:hypothetical protein
MEKLEEFKPRPRVPPRQVDLSQSLGYIWGIKPTVPTRPAVGNMGPSLERSIWVSAGIEYSTYH